MKRRSVARKSAADGKLFASRDVRLHVA